MTSSPAVNYYSDNRVLPSWGTTPEQQSNPGLWWALIILMLVCLSAGGWYYLKKFKPMQNAKDSTVLIMVDADGDRKFESSGTGVLINSKGYILTARHVVTKENGDPIPGKIRVDFRSGTAEVQHFTDVTVEKLAERGSQKQDFVNGDWALLKVVSRTALPSVPLSTRRDYQELEVVQAFGFPHADVTATNEFGAQVKVVEGKINRVDRNAQGGVVRLTHNASTGPGMSGGPIMQNGELVAITVAGLKNAAANENYSLPTHLLRDTLKNYLESH